jgi:hypothetical protein
VKQVACYSDDLVWLALESGDQSFAQSIFIGERRIGELFADDQDLPGFPHFLVGEVAATQQRNVHRVQVVLIYTAEVTERHLVASNGRTSF